VGFNARPAATLSFAASFASSSASKRASTPKKPSRDEANFVPTFYTTKPLGPSTKANEDFNFDFKVQLPSIDEHFDVEELQFLLKNGIKIPIAKINTQLRFLAEESEDFHTSNRRHPSPAEAQRIAQLRDRMMDIFYGMLDCSIQPDIYTFYYLSRGLAR